MVRMTKFYHTESKISHQKKDLNLINNFVKITSEFTFKRTV